MLCLSRKHNNIFSLPSIFAGEFFVLLTHSHPLRSGILALCNKRWLEVFLRNRVEFTAVFELTLDLVKTEKILALSGWFPL